MLLGLEIAYSNHIHACIDRDDRYEDLLLNLCAFVGEHILRQSSFSAKGYLKVPPKSSRHPSSVKKRPPSAHPCFRLERKASVRQRFSIAGPML